MTQRQTIPLAREYLRVSHDSSGRARSVAEQHDDNARAGEVHGFALNGEAYKDPDVSASRYSRKIRGDFARLLADLQSGAFGADILVLWESSRGSRRVGEWATLADALEDAKVKVHVTTHGRTYDPANPRDLRSLMEDAVDSQYESGKASGRIKRALAANAAEGKPHGRVTYGYERRYDLLPSGRRVLVGQFPYEPEAAVVRELFERLHAGHAFRAIAKDFASRGTTRRDGQPFSAEHLRDMALRPAYGGYRTHEPGRTAGGTYTGSLDGAVKASWPALVDAETFWAVRTMLLRPSRRTSRPGRGVHLLSMIARCGVCGSVMSARFRRGERLYVCHGKWCTAIEAGALDELAEQVMLGYLSRPANIAQLRAAPDAEVAQVRAELAQARAELAELRALGGARKLTPAMAAAMEPPLVAAVEQHEQRERELTTPSELAWLAEPGAEMTARWKAAPMAARRSAAKLLLAPAYLGTLLVDRQDERGRGKRAPAHERVRFERPETVRADA